MKTAAANGRARPAPRAPAIAMFLILAGLATLCGAPMLRAAASRASAAPARAANAPAPAAADATALRDLLAHGTDQHYWSADVAPNNDPHAPGVHTLVRYRAAGDVEWKELADLADRAT